MAIQDKTIASRPKQDSTNTETIKFRHISMQHPVDEEHKCQPTLARRDRLHWIYGIGLLGKHQRPMAEAHEKVKTKRPQHKKYAMNEIARYPAIKEWKWNIALAHALGEIDLRKTGRLLSSQDKSRLRLEYDKPVTSEMLALVEPALIPFFDINEALTLITSNALKKYEVHRQWNEIAQNGQAGSIFYLTCLDDMTCKWCRAYSHRPLKTRFNLPENIKRHCTCPWFRGSVVFEEADQAQLGHRREWLQFTASLPRSTLVGR